MKKHIFTLMLLICLTLIIFTVPVAAAETYNFGNGPENLAQTDMGKDGFYYMFTTEYNTGGKYDISKIQECIWGRNSAFSMYVPGRKLWCPSIAQVDTGKFKNDAMWWNIKGTGNLMASNGISCVLKWVAPNDGKYKVHSIVLGGLSQAYTDHQTEYGPFPTSLDMDGVTCSIYQGNKKLFSKNSLILVDGKVDKDKNFITNNNLNAPDQKVELKKGEALYFITDQNAKANYDDSNWKITITKTGELTKPSSSKASTVSTTSSTSKSSSSVTSTSMSSTIEASSISSEDSSLVLSVSNSSLVSSVNNSSESSTEVKNGNKNKFLTVAVIIGAVVILAGTVIFLVLNQKKDKK